MAGTMRVRVKGDMLELLAVVLPEGTDVSVTILVHLAT
jgi:hypothetical protein